MEINSHFSQHLENKIAYGEYVTMGSDYSKNKTKYKYIELFFKWIKQHLTIKNGLEELLTQ
ncbi:MAG: hypothetical protein RSB70_05920 [Clostridium sp.]